MTRRLLLALAPLLPAAVHAQGADARPPVAAFDFSIANMMRGPEVYGREPQAVRWSPDGRWIYFQWLPPGTSWRESPKPYRVRAQAGAAPEAVTPAHMDSAGPLLAPGAETPDRRRRVVSYQGDLYLVDLAGATSRRLTQTTATERSPAFSTDGRELFFVRDDAVFGLTLDGAAIRQLLDVRKGEAPKPDKPAVGQRGALERQQRELLAAVRDELWRDSVTKAEEARRDSLSARPLYLGKTERVAQLSVSPSGRALLLATSVPSESASRTIIPKWVTASGYTEDLTMRTKVGDAQERGRVAFVTTAAGDVRWLNLTPGDTNPASLANLVGWNPAGDAALVFTVSRDYKTRWLHQVGSDGSITTLDVLRDTAWVGGPCSNCAGWMPDGQRAWFVSEADGYAHLYSVARGGGDRRQLTSGMWEVLGVELTHDDRAFALTTNEGSPFEQHVWRMPLAGGTRTRLTSAKGSHDAVASPDGRWLANIHSTANRPPELFLMRNAPGAEMAQLTTSPTADWLAFDWVKPEIVRIPASDGVQVPARIYKPSDMGARPNGAAVIFVHGAGYLHNVHDYWSTYAREYMFNQYLASKGYVVLDVDYRGSAGYGRDWRTAIYRHMGGRDLQDHVDASKWLQREHGISPDRVGLYGGSYGGFITLMALFTAPEQFGAGAALRSVTDLAHYNHPYTARILNFPDTDTLAYRRSSPIYFAEGLQDPLLIAHGMVDVNVHFQDVVRLSQRLIELGKTDWEMAVYPVEDHAFVRPTSWTDEYRRIFELFERHLPAQGPVTGGR